MRVQLTQIRKIHFARAARKLYSMLFSHILFDPCYLGTGAPCPFCKTSMVLAFRALLYVVILFDPCCLGTRASSYPKRRSTLKSFAKKGRGVLRSSLSSLHHFTPYGKGTLPAAEGGLELAVRAPVDHRVNWVNRVIHRGSSPPLSVS